jgi:gluconokinase
MACSALKPEYRDILKRKCDSLQFIYLKGDFDTIWQRHKQREGHYFTGENMLKSQFNTLVEPSEVEAIHVNIDNTPEVILDQILRKLG